MKLASLCEGKKETKLLKEVVETYPKFCAKWGITKGAKFLGKGMLGVTYDIGSKRVVKLTADAKEAKTKLYPISGKTCGKQGCSLPAVYKDSSGSYDHYYCGNHMPESVKANYTW